MIGRNQALINSAVFTKLVAAFYHTKNLKKSDLREITHIQHDIVSKFNVVAIDDRFLGTYSSELLFVTFYVFNSSVKQELYIKAITEIVDNLTIEEIRYMRIAPTGAVRRVAMNIMAEKIKPYID